VYQEGDRKLYGKLSFTQVCGGSVHRLGYSALIISPEIKRHCLAMDTREFYRTEEHLPRNIVDELVLRPRSGEPAFGIYQVHDTIWRLLQSYRLSINVFPSIACLLCVIKQHQRYLLLTVLLSQSQGPLILATIEKLCPVLQENLHDPFIPLLNSGL
jgi:hypothetical protein